MISIWVTDRRPCRLEVPMQSEPVSPPPMTTTCLPPARIGLTLLSGSSRCGGSAAAKIPWRNGCRRARGRGSAGRAASGAAGQRDRVVPGLEIGDRHVAADMHAIMEGHAFGFHLGDAAVEVALLHLEVGDAVAHQAAAFWFFSYRCTSWPARASCWAQARPEGPEPITATVLPVLFGLMSGVIHAVLPALVDDGAFDRLDADRRVDELMVQARLARGGGRCGR